MNINPILASISSGLGYDFIILDGEHGSFNQPEFEEGFRYIKQERIATMVRVANQDSSPIVKYSEMGADAIVVPNVATVAEARTLAELVGQCGNSELIVLLESALASENAEEILAIDGVDAGFIGPSDLSADLGKRGDFASPLYARALTRIEQAAAVTGKAVGTAPHGPYSLQELHSRGHRILVLGSDASILTEGLEAQMANVRELR